YHKHRCLVCTSAPNVSIRNDHGILRTFVLVVERGLALNCRLLTRQRIAPDLSSLHAWTAVTHGDVSNTDGLHHTRLLTRSWSAYLRGCRQRTNSDHYQSEQKYVETV